MQISITVPTRNRSFLLNKMIRSLTMQTFPQENFEVIVVDNGSIDDTKDVVELYQKKFPNLNLNYIFIPSPGLHVGRHKGLELARGEILVYADDDIEAFPTWLEGIAESFEDPDVALVGGNNLPKYEIEPPEWIDKLWINTPYGKQNWLYSVLDFGEKKITIPPHYIWGCNFSIRKKCLLKIGGFHPDGMPDSLLKYRGDGETAVSNEIKKTGYKTIFNPKASVYHFVSAKRMTMEYIYKRGYIQGISNSYSNIRRDGEVELIHSGKKYYSYLIFMSKRFLKQLFGDQIEPYTIFNQGLWDGFFFHRSEVKKDKQLLEWVLQEDYFGEKGNINEYILKK